MQWPLIVVIYFLVLRWKNRSMSAILPSWGKRHLRTNVLQKPPLCISFYARVLYRQKYPFWLLKLMVNYQNYFL
jgi:hypothetical protein